MTWLKIGVAVVVVFIVVVGILAARKPDVFRVQRGISIKAAPEKIFPLINDLHRWSEWSAYEKKDPAMKRTFSGSQLGVGAVYEWSGDKNVGSGRMEIIHAEAPSKVTIKLDFITPFEGHNTAEFTLTPNATAGVTDVTWAMYGPAVCLSKIMQVFIDMDHMVGKDFELGLEALKVAAEK